jgi:hypothetical protein
MGSRLIMSLSARMQALKKADYKLTKHPSADAERYVAGAQGGEKEYAAERGNVENSACRRRLDVQVDEKIPRPFVMIERQFLSCSA